MYGIVLGLVLWIQYTIYNIQYTIYNIQYTRYNNWNCTWTGQGKTLTILMSRLLIIMALLTPICIQSQLISISIYSVPRATHRGVKKAFLLLRPLGSDVFCSTSQAFEQRAADLTKFLVYRGYREKFVHDQIK